MWIVCAVVSVVFCVIAWVLKAKENEKAGWASVSSLAFLALTLLMELREILGWVNQSDLAAMQDVVPTMFPMLCGFVILMLLANIVPNLKK